MKAPPPLLSIAFELKNYPLVTSYKNTGSFSFFLSSSPMHLTYAPSNVRVPSLPVALLSALAG